MSASVADQLVLPEGVLLFATRHAGPEAGLMGSQSFDPFKGWRELPFPAKARGQMLFLGSGWSWTSVCEGALWLQEADPRLCFPAQKPKEGRDLYR